MPSHLRQILDVRQTASRPPDTLEFKLFRSSPELASYRITPPPQFSGSHFPKGMSSGPLGISWISAIAALEPVSGTRAARAKDLFAESFVGY